jgi:trans-aconitate 2-methyltransferase
MAEGGGDTWRPERYEQFKEERRQPFVDLLGLCRPVPGGRLVDLGCGTGDLTAEAHAALSPASTLGLDSSFAMLEQAVTRHGAVEGLEFAAGDLAEWAAGDDQVDLVLANASLHWVDDHRRLLARLRLRLAQGGQLAFQVPSNFGHISHLAAAAVAAEPPFAALLGDRAPSDRGQAVLAPEHYAEILFDLGADEQTVRRQVYGHVLPSVSAVADWAQGTLLTPYRGLLDDEHYAEFLARYRARLVRHLGEQEPYFYAFPRVLAWARFP